MEKENKLQRQFGLWTAVALIVGQVIAVGIFLTPAGMAKSVGSPFWLLIIWLVIGAMTLSGAFCYAELSARFPEAGGSYVYLREAYGKGTAFVYAWMDLLVLDPGLTAFLAAGLSSYAAYIFQFSSIGQKLLAISVVAFIGIINILGAKISANFLKVLTFLKISILLFIILYGFLGGFGNWENFTPFYSVPNDVFGAFAGGIVGAFIAFAGWWEVTRIAGEMKEPEKNLPKALAVGVLVITVIYILTSTVFFYLVPVANVTSDETFAAQAGEILFGKIGGVIFASIVVLSVFGTLFAYLLAAPRVYYAMARDGLFFSTFSQLHPKFGTPHRAILIQIFLAFILILSGTFNEIISYFFFAVVFFIGLTVAGLFKIRRQEFSGYKTTLYPFTPLFYLFLTIIVLLLIALQNPTQTFWGVAVVLLGIPVYHFIFKKKPKPEI